MNGDKKVRDKTRKISYKLMFLELIPVQAQSLPGAGDSSFSEQNFALKLPNTLCLETTHFRVSPFWMELTILNGLTSSRHTSLPKKYGE